VDDNNKDYGSSILFGVGKISLDINGDGNELNELKRKLETSEVSTTVFRHYSHILINIIFS
jgi:hypothetical protein